MKKIKLKKEINYFIIGITILILIFIILMVKTSNNKELTGNKIVDGVYLYQLKEKNYVQNVIIKDNNIYYITGNGDTYKLYELDIYKNETKEIGTIESDVCLLNNYYLSCIRGEVTTVYDINLKEIYKSNKTFNIVPYQDSFLIVNNKDIYLDNQKIRTIKDDIKRFDILDYYVSSDNTFIEFVSLNDTYIYSVKDDSYEKINCDNMFSYEKGIYYGSKEKIIIKNLDNNTVKEYYNFKKDSDFSSSVIKNNLYIYLDYGYLKIYNLDTNKFKYIDYKFVNSMDKVLINGNYLYLIYQGESPKIYVARLDELNLKEYTLEEYKKIQINKLSKKVEYLEKNYNNVEIIYDSKDIDNYDKWNEKIVNEDRYELVDEALDAINNVFNKFSNEFLSIFKHNDYKGLRIVISKKIVASEDAGVKDLTGLFFSNYTNYNIIIANSDIPYEKSFCHEMMHAIDYNASNNKYEIDSKWYDYNPKDFEYSISHYNNQDIRYTISDQNPYFVDSYSMLNQSEDRARIFENICYVDGENIIKKYPNLLMKAEYLRDELIKYYPSIINSKIFDNLK